jgi:alkylhydroperoxidase/carboxymuconolactone decarboxylase family protein YurZ
MLKRGTIKNVTFSGIFSVDFTSGSGFLFARVAGCLHLASCILQTIIVFALERKQRSLINQEMLAALGEMRGLRTYFHSAIHNSATQEELWASLI